MVKTTRQTKKKCKYGTTVGPTTTHNIIYKYKAEQIRRSNNTKLTKLKPTYSKLRTSYKYNNNTCTRNNRKANVLCQYYIYNTANTFTQT